MSIDSCIISERNKLNNIVGNSTLPDVNTKHSISSLEVDNASRNSVIRDSNSEINTCIFPFQSTESHELKELLSSCDDINRSKDSHSKS